MKNEEASLNMNGWAFMPFLLLVAIPIANTVYNAISGLPQSANYLPTLAIVGVPAIFALFYGKGTVKQKTDAFCKGAANESIIMMVLIFCLAGAFSTVNKTMGGIDSVVNLCLRFLPANLAYAGVFIISALISLAIGTSVGTITAMAPIAYALVIQVGLNPSIGLSAVVGGAVFGDNLSMISDTTIAAVRGMGCEMRDKFKMNILVVLPAFVLAVVIYAVLGSNASGGAIEAGDFNLLKILPYPMIIILALTGLDVTVTLSLGIVVSGVIGILLGDYNLVTLVKAISTGISGMSTVTFSVILVSGMMGVIRLHGGLDWLLQKASVCVHTQRGCEYMMCFLAMALSFQISGTSAIVTASPLVKPLADRYGIEPRRSAALVDMFATQTTALVFWAGLTVIAVNLAGDGSPIELVKYAIYPYLVILTSLLSIQLRLFPGAKEAKAAEAEALQRMNAEQ